MSPVLKPILEDTTNCSKIIFSDKTGTSSTGYQNTFAPARIYSSKLELSLINCSDEHVYNFTDTQAQDLANEVSTFEVEDYEESNLLKAKYTVFFEAPNETLFEIEEGSDTLTISGSEFNEYLDFNSVIIDGEIYEIKTYVVGETEITVTLATTYTGENVVGQTGIFGYSKNFYHAHVCTINKCLHGKIATLSTETCSCRDKSIDKVARYLFMFFAIDVHIESMNYKKAQEIIEALKIFCQSDKTCGC